ncbi:MAG TPA: hypothetical protein VM638_05740, partial [Actinomycetota bacterium]|nr:hypothetical protein [Actinomycetota bacterium]
MTAPSDAGAHRGDAYHALRQRHLQEMRQLLPEHLDRVAWSREELAAERLRRLRHLLRVAKARSSWHRERLSGVDPERFREEDLASVPAMTKEELMESFDDVLTEPSLTLERVEDHLDDLEEGPAYLPGGYQAITSSGSSGRRGVFVYDFRGWTEKFLGWIRYLVREIGTGKRFAIVAGGSPSHGSRLLLQTFSDPEVFDVRPLPTVLPQERIVQGLNALQPEVLAGYATAIGALSPAAAEGRLRIQPRAVVTGGEPLLPELRALIEQAWRVPVHDWWLSSEAGAMGIGCGRGDALHLSDDLLIVEPVDRHGNPVPPGEAAAKIYVTNLFNTALPLIRYEMSDEVTLLPETGTACGCGSQHRRVAAVQGRVDDAFVYAGGPIVHPHVFRAPLGRQRDVIEYQVRQTSDGAAVSIVTGGRTDLD